jgi:multiple sugar transport system ATP-binding protein
MDEPMSNLDAKLRTELRADLAATQQRLGVTTIYVTHDQVEAMALGHRVAVMRDGRIVQCGTPIEVYEHPIDLFVATFVGSPPMNVLVAEVVDGRRLRLGRHEVDLGRSASRWPTLGTYTGRDVLLGVRPESIGLSDDGDLTVEVLHVESLGAERFALATLEARGVRPDGDDWRTESPTTVSIAVTSPTPVDPFRPVPVRLDTERVHLFDPDGGARLPGRDDAVPLASAGGDGLAGGRRRQT